MDKIKEGIPTVDDIREGANRMTESILENAENAKANVREGLSNFSSQNYINSGQEFLNSNSMIAKFGFIILSVIIFLVLAYLGMRLIFYFLAPSTTPYIVKGVLAGNSGITISQNVDDPNSIYLYKSNNREGGLEMTWSVWLYVTGTSNTSNYDRVFIKGKDDPKTDTTNISSDNQFPGVYIKINSNQVSIYFSINPVNNISVDISVNNIPLNKWFHVAFRVQNTVADVYINGTIANRTVFNSIPIHNDYPILIGNNGGFQGNLSNLRYYDYALSAFEINNIILGGPSLYPSDLSKDSRATNISYISSNWYNNNM